MAASPRGQLTPTTVIGAHYVHNDLRQTIEDLGACAHAWEMAPSIRLMAIAGNRTTTIARAIPEKKSIEGCLVSDRVFCWMSPGFGVTIRRRSTSVDRRADAFNQLM
jgi:hypothetical protein